MNTNARMTQRKSRPAAKARSGLTFIELLLAGFILSTVAFGAISGMLHVSRFVDRRAELLAADGFCWDVAWALFNDYRMLKWYMDGAPSENTGELAYPRSDVANCFEIKGTISPEDGMGAQYDFLSHLQYPGSPPVCYITLSNRVDAVTKFPIKDGGIYVSVNLEWGPANARRILVRRADTPDDAYVFDHPITVFRSPYSRGVSQ